MFDIVSYLFYNPKSSAFKHLTIESTSGIPIVDSANSTTLPCVVGSRSNNKHLTRQPRPDPASALEVRKSARAPRPRQMDTGFVDLDFAIEDEDNDEKVYYMESILDESGSGKSLKYKIKWQGYDEADSTWEPASYVRTIMLETVLEWHEGRKAERVRALASARAGRAADKTEALMARRKLATEQFESAREKAKLFTLSNVAKVEIQDRICLNLKTSRGFTPCTNQRPLDKPGSLNMWDKLKYVLRVLMFALFVWFSLCRRTRVLLRVLVRSLSAGARCLRTERFPLKRKGHGWRL
jgi:hypothetical protein